jgi:hypothetical protein
MSDSRYPQAGKGKTRERDDQGTLSECVVESRLRRVQGIISVHRATITLVSIAVVIGSATRGSSGRWLFCRKVVLDSRCLGTLQKDS